MNVSFYVDGNPVSLNNAYFNRGRGRTMTSEARAWKELVAWHARAVHKGKPSKGRIELSIWLDFPDKRRRDIDNFAKIACDAMKGIAYADDSQIDHLHLHRRHGTPGIAVHVRDLPLD